MRKWLVPLFVVLAVNVSAVEFTSISKKNPVALTHRADFTAYVDINLDIDLAEAGVKELFIRLRYIIGTDTLHDNITVKGARNGMVKQLLLNEGERLIAQILLNNAEIAEVAGVKGSLTLGTNTTMKVTTDLGKTTFVGNVWVREQNPLFRVKFDDAAPRDVQLLFQLDPNFEYDKLHFKIKVISPEQGILFLNRSITVNEEATLGLRARTLKVSMDGVNFSYPGTYYFQITHEMGADRINGIERLDHAVVPL